jgi:hypothetical protein
MITPEQKARELVFRFFYIDSDSKLLDDFTMTMFYAKRCALIAVEEILNEYWSHDTKRRDWWHEVKQKIEKL